MPSVVAAERERERDCEIFWTRATEAASDMEPAVAKRDLKSVAVVVLSSVEVEGDEEGSVLLWNPYMWLKSGFHIHGASWIPFCGQTGGHRDADDGLADPWRQDVDGGVAVVVQEGEELGLLQWDVETRVEHSVEGGFVLAQETF